MTQVQGKSLSAAPPVSIVDVTIPGDADATFSYASRGGLWLTNGGSAVAIDTGAVASPVALGDVPVGRRIKCVYPPGVMPTSSGPTLRVTAVGGNLTVVAFVYDAGLNGGQWVQLTAGTAVNGTSIALLAATHLVGALLHVVIAANNTATAIGLIAS
jgi:hypothetical protein